MLSYIKSTTDSAKVTSMSISECAPNFVPPDSVEEDDETCAGSGSSSNGDDLYHEEVNESITSEEETDAVKGFNILKACKYASSHPDDGPESTESKPNVSSQSSNPDDGPESTESKQKPARTKLSSSALVFIPGARTSVPGTKCVQDGRDLLTLLKTDAKESANSRVPMEDQQKPRRTKLSGTAQAFVPRTNLVQPTGFVPMMQMLPTLLIPMCTTNEGSNGFDDSPRATPRMTHPDNQPDMANHADDSDDSMDNCHEHQEHPTDPIQQSDERKEVSSKAPPKPSWADLYEDDEELGNDLWFGSVEPMHLDASAQNDLLSLS